MATSAYTQIRRGEARYRRWLAAQPDAPAGKAAVLRWLREDLGLPATFAGPARFGVRPDGVEDVYPSPDWMARELGWPEPTPVAAGAGR